MISKSREIRN